jgi:hypothetical protein
VVISDLRAFVQQQYLLSDVNGGVEILQSSRYGPSDPASPDRFWIFSRFCRLWFIIYLWLPSEEYKIMFWKKKKFEDLEDLLLSFRLYFVIVGVSSSLPCTICYYEYMYICGIDLKKLPPLSL